MYSYWKNFFIGEFLKNSNSFHDKSRVGLLFNITFVLLFLGIIASVVSLIIGTYPVLIPALGNVFLALVSLLLIKYKNFQFSAAVYFIALFILLFGNLNFNEGTMHVGSPFWIMILNILVMYVLGRVWGTFTIIASVLGFSYYVVFVLPISLEIFRDLPAATYYTALYETVFALFLLGYIISTILIASRNSDKLLKEQNNALIDQNKTISLNIEEKTVLLKEIHHRVKNNLQVIISLMRLQMRDLKSPEAISKFKETINRVLTMSMIHEKMYQSESLSQINIEQYFQDLSNDLLTSFETGFKVKFNFEFYINTIEVKSVVPLALIFNELFSNSLKHAFSETTSPSIDLSLRMTDQNVIVLEYMDNGNWINPSSEMTFGLELIDSLTQQLDGTMEFSSEPNTKYIFRFNESGF